MVPLVASGLSRLSSQATISEIFANSSTQQLSASNEQEKVISDRLLCFRRYLQKKGASKEASNIKIVEKLNSINIHGKLGCIGVVNKYVDPIAPNEVNIVNYLTTLCLENRSYS